MAGEHLFYWNLGRVGVPTKAASVHGGSGAEPTKRSMNPEARFKSTTQPGIYLPFVWPLTWNWTSPIRVNLHVFMDTAISGDVVFRTRFIAMEDLDEDGPSSSTNGPNVTVPDTALSNFDYEMDSNVGIGAHNPGKPAWLAITRRDNLENDSAAGYAVIRHVTLRNGL